MSFRLEDNVPEVYVEKSRDFQLLCRILNIFLTAAIEESAKIPGNWDLDSLDEWLLPLAARKLGLIENSYFPPKILRNICKSWNHIIRNKGTERAVREAAYAVFSVNQDIVTLEVSRTATDQIYEQGSGGITVRLTASTGSIEDLAYLEKLLPYILPAGVGLASTINITHENHLKTPPISSIVEIIRHRGVGAAISKVVAGGVVEGENSTYAIGDWSKSLKQIQQGLPKEVSITSSKVNVSVVVPGVMNGTSVYVKDPEISNKN